MLDKIKLEVKVNLATYGTFAMIGTATIAKIIVETTKTRIDYGSYLPEAILIIFAGVSIFLGGLLMARWLKPKLSTRWKRLKNWAMS